MNKKALTIFLALSLLAGLTVGLVGCQKEGAGERAGKKMDNLLNKASDKLDKLRD